MKSSSFLSIIFTASVCACSTTAMGQAPAVKTSNPARASDGVQVGVAAYDGVTVSGGEAYITRNGSTEKLTKELRLPSGLTVRPDGTATLSNGSSVTLQAEQLLTLEGKVIELPSDPAENPGDPRGNGTGTRLVVPVSPSGIAVETTTSTAGSRLRRNGGGSSTVFLGGDGVPFMGTINPSGTVTRMDGTELAIDGTFRPITFGLDGNPRFGTLNTDGTITRVDGATIALDGSIRAADGTVISAARQSNAGVSTQANTATNGDNTATTNTQQGVGGTQQGVPTQQGVGGTQQIDPRTGQPFVNPGSSRNTNSPNNTGTLNRTNPTPDATGSAANGGTVNTPAQSQPASGGTDSSGATSGTTGGTNSRAAGSSNTRSSGGGATSGGGGAGTGGISGASKGVAK